MKPSTDDYTEALKKIKLSGHHERMLQAHYYSAGKVITATEMSKAMSYPNYNSSNLHYGKLGKEIGKEIGWIPSKDESSGAPGVYVICEVKKYGGEWHWTLRKEMIDSLEKLKIVGECVSIVPVETSETETYFEGALRKISVNSYERSNSARNKCILHYGSKCTVCGINLSDIYGDIAQGFIHVHHVKPLSEINEKYVVDPIKDLRPVCPNCHSIIHLKNPSFSMEEVQSFVKKQ